VRIVRYVRQHHVGMIAASTGGSATTVVTGFYVTFN
jgi:hypothetical protein